MGLQRNKCSIKRLDNKRNITNETENFGGGYSGAIGKWS